MLVGESISIRSNMAVIPNYNVQYEHLKIRILVRSENGSAVVIPDYYRLPGVQSVTRRGSPIPVRMLTKQSTLIRKNIILKNIILTV